MTRYSLEWCDMHLDSLLDKMGSDYFSLPIKLDRFVTLAYDFIHKHTKDLEITQEASDQLKNILVKDNFPIVKSDTEILSNVWEVPEPGDYLRLISILPLIEDELSGKYLTKAKKPATLREGQVIAYSRDPFRKASAEYPNVTRISNFFNIDVGDDVSHYDAALMAYVKKPIFAEITQLEKRIVNLSDIAIEKILNKTADSLRVTTGDPTVSATYPFNQSFGKKNK